jgi:hypothetical protein
MDLLTTHTQHSELQVTYIPVILLMLSVIYVAGHQSRVKSVSDCSRFDAKVYVNIICRV